MVIDFLQSNLRKNMKPSLIAEISSETEFYLLC